MKEVNEEKIRLENGNGKPRDSGTKITKVKIYMPNYIVVRTLSSANDRNDDPLVF